MGEVVYICRTHAVHVPCCGVHVPCIWSACAVHMECMSHLVDEAEEVAGSSRLCDGDARARCAAQRERRRAEVGGIVTSGEGAQAHNV